VEFDGGRHKYLSFFFMVSFVTHVSASRLNESTISNRMTPNMVACIAVESISILEKLHSKISYLEPNVLRCMYYC
jgi:hypothetical protein